MKLFLYFEKVFIYIGIASLAVMMLLMLSEMFTRFGIPHLFLDSYALVGFMMVGVTYLGLSYIQKHDDHLKMTLFISKLNEKNSNIVKLFMNAIEIIILLAIIIQTSKGALRAYEIGDTTTEPGAYINWPIRALVPLGLSVYCLRLIIESFQQGAELFHKKHGYSSDQNS